MPECPGNDDPAQMQALLNRKVSEGLSYQQVADESGIPMGTLAARGRRARAKAAPEEAGLVEVLVADSSPPSTIWIETTTGLKVHIAPDFDETTPARLLLTLPLDLRRPKACRSWRSSGNTSGC